MRRSTTGLHALWLGMLLLAGCTKTLHFAVRDAATGSPLPGVTTSWHEHRLNPLTGYSHETGPTNLPPSGDDGLVTISGVHEHWSNRFSFSCSGYRTIYGRYHSGIVRISDRLLSFPRGTSQLDAPCVEAAEKGRFLIYMHRHDP
jgi:hypothetical protein